MILSDIQHCTSNLHIKIIKGRVFRHYLQHISHATPRIGYVYAEQLHEVATTLVHDTYLQRFEGVEGDLIAQDAALVEDLEKDFNVTLPQAISKDLGVDAVRKAVEAMQVKLDRARELLVKAEKSRKDVF